MKKYLITAVVVLAALLILTANYAVKQRAEKLRFESNQNALLNKITYYRDAHGRAEASVQKLTLTVEEFRDREEEYVNLCSELDVKIKRLLSAAKTEVSNNLNITAPVHDTTIIHDTITEVVKNFRWSDAWTDIEGLIIRDSIQLKYHSKDTLYQIVHRVPRRFLFFRFGTKAIKQEVRLSNPHSNIIYTEYIELKK